MSDTPTDSTVLKLRVYDLGDGTLASETEYLHTTDRPTLAHALHAIAHEIDGTQRACLVISDTDGPNLAFDVVACTVARPTLAAYLRLAADALEG